MTYDPDAFDRELKKRLDDMHPSIRQQFLREIVYEQIIVSVPASVAYLQGGAGVRYQLEFSAQTKDVDMLIREEVAAETNLLSMGSEDRKRYLIGYMRKLIEARKPDYCMLRVVGARSFEDVRTNELVAQLVLEAEVVLQKLQHTVELDFGVQSHPVMVRQIPSRQLLSFAGLENPPISVLSPEELTAIKICVYLENHHRPERFRAQDIAHAAALISNHSFDNHIFAQALAFNAAERDIVHKLLLPMPTPNLPQSRSLWQFEDLAKECKIPTDLNLAIKILFKSYNLVNNQAYQLALELREQMKAHGSNSAEQASK